MDSKDASHLSELHRMPVCREPIMSITSQNNDGVMKKYCELPSVAYMDSMFGPNGKEIY